MICPKCGDEYEDDMPCCLWCDAPNPNYGQAGESLEQKAVSVLEHQENIDGFAFLENPDGLDLRGEAEGCVEFKITSSERVKAFLWMLFCLVYIVVCLVGLFTVDDDSLRVIFLLALCPFCLVGFFLSKTVFAVEWYKDKYVLKTLHGKKEFPFDESARPSFVYSDQQGFVVSLKKGWQTFSFREKGFPEVTRMLCRIYDELRPTDIVQSDDGSMCAVFKPLQRPAGMAGYFVSFFVLVFYGILQVGLLDEASSDVGYGVFSFLFAFLSLFIAFYRAMDVLEIKWYKDKFVLCTRFGEKEFSFAKSELYKTKCNENGTRMFVFKKGIMPSIVDERSFPKAVEMMKDLYCEE